MKKFLFTAVLAGMVLAGCKEYDDSDIKNQLSDHERRIAALESAVTAANAQISGVQTVLTSIQQGDWITSVTTLSDGYTINFSKGAPITIKHGAKGENGQAGKDGETPVIGVGEHGGAYYWTITVEGKTEWMEDDKGNKIPAAGAKGNDGLTPVFGVDNDGYWTIKWGDNPAEHLLSSGKKVLARASDIPFRLEISVESSELVFDFFESGKVIRIPYAQPFSVSIEGIDDYTLTVEENDTEQFTVIVANITADDYLSLSAEITGRAGNAADVHIKSGASSPWDVEISAPVFDSEGATFTLTIISPNGINSNTNEPNARLTLSLLATNGKETTAVFALKVPPSGSELNPFLISTADQLAALSAEVNAGDYKAGKHYKMTGNIDLSAYGTSNTNFNDGKGWIPIGIFYTDLKNRRPFSGSFDGGGHIILGLSIYAAVGSTNDNGKAMFGYIAPGAVVKNLGLEGGSVAGNDQLGILAGRNRGTVQNCYATGSVSGQDFLGGLVGWNQGTIKNSYAKVSVTGRHFVGGLVGQNSDNGEDNIVATVHNSYAAGKVKGSGNSAGGLVGVSSGTVHNSYATGDVEGVNNTGGLVGVSSGTVQDSYATGSVMGNNSVGGLVGENSGSSAKVHNSVALNPSVVAAGSNIGRVAGNNASSASLSGNYARDDMEMEIAGAPYEPTMGTAQADKTDGANTSTFSTQLFWTGMMLTWDFAANGAWEWKAGFLPILRSVGGEQAPRVQEAP